MTYEKACEVICAVTDRDRIAVHAAIGGLNRTELQSLTIMLAAMVPTDTALSPAAVLQARAAHLQMTIHPDSHPALAVLADHVAAMFGVPLNTLYSDSRVQRVTEARQILCFVAHKRLDLSFSAIARHVGRDHTTVIHAVRRVTTDAGLRAKAAIVTELMQQDSEEVA